MQDETAPQGVQNIVAIAASAGGLESTSLLAQNLPSDQDCCYVIAQHMSPSHKSMLVQLLSRETKLGVEELQPTTYPQANVIYVPPPGNDVIFENGAFKLREPPGHPASPKPSGDRLFKSLAESVGNRAIGIVLSGTGSDGSYGVQAIREFGGITIAQEPSTSKYDSMPVSAIRTGCIDLTLTPQQIGAHLVAILKRPRDLSSLKEMSEQAHRARDLFDILLSQTSVDFRQYKETTINRRIQRRMLAKNISEFDEYVSLCRRSVEEVEALYRDLLISVTRFFRDPDQFAVLGQRIREKFKNTGSSESIRVWIPGCATGEEAYTIAILIIEALGGLETLDREQLQVFATDLDESALNIGRKGVYPHSAVSDIPERFLEEYFEMKDDVVQVKPRLRAFVMFSRHNVFQDAPFTSIDLVSIRNVLIYFNTKLQERVLTRIVYSLRPNGMLFLGTSENVGNMETYFAGDSNEARLFKLRDRKLTASVTESAFRNLSSMPQDRTPARNATPPPTAEAEWRTFDRLAEVVAETGFLVDRDQNILRIYGDIAPFCQLTSKSFGQSTLSILKRPLAADAASMTLVALKKKSKREGQWHELESFHGRMIRLTAYPVEARSDHIEGLVLFGISVVEKIARNDSSKDTSEYATYIEDELARTRDALTVTVEQLQTANEELQALNEELQSSNEELQAANEELETSNEELQSSNEELITVNEELLVNASQLERATAELSGFVANNPTPILMVDQGLIVRYASENAKRLFALSERGDGFGHLSQVNQPSEYPPLVEVCSRALLSRQGSESRFDVDGTKAMLTISPIEAPDKQLIGLVLQFLWSGADRA